MKNNKGIEKKWGDALVKVIGETNFFSTKKFLDLKNSLDSFKMELGLKNTEHYGLRRKLLKLLKIYLCEREHCQFCTMHVRFARPRTVKLL